MQRLLPSRRILTASGALVALLLITSIVFDGPPAESGPTFRVMTYNIHHGADAEGNLDIGRIADVIRSERADIVALQEVDRGVRRSGERDLLLELAELTGLEHHAFGENLEFQGGAYGNGVISRYRIISSSNTHLEQIGPHEQRGVLEVVLDVEGVEVALLNIHLDHMSQAERLFSIRQIEEKLLPRHARLPLILAGDLNDVPDGPVYDRVTSLLEDAWLQAGEGPGYTFPADVPDRRIDYVFHSDGVVPAEASVPTTRASDHRPVAVACRLID